MLKRTMNAMFRFLLILLTGIVWFLSGTESVYAQMHLPGSHDNNIHVHLRTNNAKADLSHVKLAIYEVAEGSYFEGEAHLLPDYEEELTHCSMEEMIEHTAEASHELEHWIHDEHPVQAVDIEECGNDFEIDFTHLEDGIYLICQENGEHDFDDDVYSVEIEPYIVEVPMIDEDGELFEEIDCVPKLFLSMMVVETKEISVEKHWDDSSNKYGKRPAEIEAVLFCNDDEFDTVVLSAANNWQNTWINLSTFDTWTVQEKTVVEGYTSEVTQEGNTFVITNHYEPEPTPTPEVTPDPSPDPSPTPTPPPGPTPTPSVTPTPPSSVPPRTNPPVPYTGDNSNLPMYALVFAAAAVLMGVTAWKLKK